MLGLKDDLDALLVLARETQDFSQEYLHRGVVELHVRVVLREKRFVSLILEDSLLGFEAFHDEVGALGDHRSGHLVVECLNDRQVFFAVHL